MNKIIIIIAAAALALPIRSETNAAPVSTDAIIAETLSVIQAEGWNARDVADAIRSLRGLYLRDTATKAGRNRWHGQIVSTSIDTNAMTQTTVYEDGETFVDAAKVTTPAQATRQANASLSTNGVPAKLAAARARRQAEAAAVSNVTVRVEAGK